MSATLPDDWAAVPIEPDDALLRPFFECPREELPQAWAAALQVAAVKRRKALHPSQRAVTLFETDRVCLATALLPVQHPVICTDGASATTVYLQWNPGWRSWEQVIPAAAGEPGVVEFMRVAKGGPT